MLLKRLLALACAGAVAGGIGVVSAGTAVAGTAGPTTAAAAPAALTLVTGDRVMVTSAGGRTAYTPVGSSRGAAFHEIRRPDGDVDVIPATAVPFLGHGLDPSLFDVSALRTDGDTGRVPVRLSFAAGHAPTAPAGVTLTSVSGNTATGYLTSASAAEFGAALRRRAGPGPMPPGLTRMALAGAPEQAPATTSAPAPTHAPTQARYALSPVQLNVTDLAGAPAANALVTLVNTDSFARQRAEQVPVSDGVAKLQSPAGHYMLIAWFQDQDADGNTTATRQVVLDDLTVSSGRGVTAFDVSESAATEQIGVRTPKPATQTSLSDVVLRTDATGATMTFSSDVTGTTPLYVNPVDPTATGTLSNLVLWSGSSTAYGYDLAFTSGNGVPADETYQVAPGQLATVRNRLYRAPGYSSAGGAMTDTLTDPLYGMFATFRPATFGTELTDYFASTGEATWAEQVAAPDGVTFTSASSLYVAGHGYTEDWGRGPVAPTSTASWNGRVCAMCAAGGTVDFGLAAFGDSDPGHSGVFMFGLPASFHLTAYRDGTEIGETTQAQPLAVAGQPLTAAAYRAVYDVDADGSALGTTSHTDLTMRYTPDAPSAGASDCDGVSPTSPCQVLPMLGAHYDLAGLGLADTSTSSRQVLHLTVDHLTVSGAGSDSPITSAGVDVSYDGGSTWHHAALTGAAGDYLASWPNPSDRGGAMPSIRITAADAAGDTLSQTITHAYRIGSAQ
ncbi:hypothetical protein [Streptomyces sp. NBC_01197]|uniref:hypothetical protein n=1 Tax=Streptomyces sp. NBC_01197 TaxID=2903768 RepID=UPI002E12E424|nr:hypothetical protein OG452_00440 [Streptomyces sp. NBC_01197]